MKKQKRKQKKEEAMQVQEVILEVINNPCVKTALKSKEHTRVYNLLFEALRGSIKAQVQLFGSFKICPVCLEANDFLHLYSIRHLQNLKTKTNYQGGGNDDSNL